MHFHHGYSGRGSWCIARFQLQFTQKFRHYFAITTAKQWQQGWKFPFLFFFGSESESLNWEAGSCAIVKRHSLCQLASFTAPKNQNQATYLHELPFLQPNLEWGAELRLNCWNEQRDKSVATTKLLHFLKTAKVCSFFGHSSSCPVGPIPSVRNCFWAK